MEPLSFFRQNMTKKAVLSSRGILTPPKSVWVAKQLFCRRVCVFKQITPFTPHITVGLNNIVLTHMNDAVRGFTCDFPSSRFGMSRGLSDHTTDPSPLTHTLEEQKVRTYGRVRMCSQLGYEHGNHHCKYAGLLLTIDTGKGQEGRVKVRVSRALWAMGLEGCWLGCWLRKSKFYRPFIPASSFYKKGDWAVKFYMSTSLDQRCPDSWSNRTSGCVYKVVSGKD